MNVLQKQPFMINSVLLKYILENNDFLVKKGILMPKFLSKLNIRKTADEFKLYYLAEEISKKGDKFPEF